MPCVLPVIGLKLMAFVQQSGDNRSRVLALNLSYTLGLFSVFMILATMVVGFDKAWGEQFSDAVFNIVLTSVVFVFALSFLGVWEIPIPGFVGSGKAGELSQKEGLVGAFFTGVLATVLATPCSGPLLVPALAWAVKQPALVAYGGFGCAALGMAAPYLVIGAFPRLIAFLPKPGAWMETFRQMMGFALFIAVVWLLTFIDIPYVVPTVAFLLGLWAACWWVGRTPPTSSLDKRMSAWLQAIAFAALIGFVSFGWLDQVMANRFQRAVDRELRYRKIDAGGLEANRGDNDSELPWRSFSLELLEQLTAQRKTVLVDFTADW
jgi:thiol:disulfide interchange protein DsbD